MMAAAQLLEQGEAAACLETAREALGSLA